MLQATHELKFEPFEVTTTGGIVFKYNAPILVDGVALVATETEAQAAQPQRPPPRSKAFPALYRRRTSLDDFEFDKKATKTTKHVRFDML